MCALINDSAQLLKSGSEPGSGDSASTCAVQLLRLRRRTTQRQKNHRFLHGLPGLTHSLLGQHHLKRPSARPLAPHHSPDCTLARTSTVSRLLSTPLQCLLRLGDLSTVEKCVALPASSSINQASHSLLILSHPTANLPGKCSVCSAGDVKHFPRQLEPTDRSVSPLSQSQPVQTADTQVLGT